MAVGASFIPGGVADPANEPFFKAMHDRSAWNGATMSEDDVRDLIATLPPTPVTTVWVEETQRVLALTADDQWRPFDLVTATIGPESDALEALDALSAALDETSALLSPVADIVGRCPLSPLQPCTLGPFINWVESVTGDTFSLDLAQDGYCDKHDDQCYGPHRSPVPWEHIEVIAPGTRARLADLVSVLTAQMPPVAEHDNLTARGRDATT
jgi:hypothetical protein